MKGKIIIFSAPSGSGKTTIIRHLLKNISGIKFSVSATSRQPRSGEENGKDYFFLTEEEFRDKIIQGEFLEYEEVYKGILYGTLKSEVERNCKKGENIILDVDVVGGLNIKKLYGEDALAVFIKPPSLEELEKRLQNRSTESRDKIKMRIDKAKKELKFENKFDTIIINDKLSAAIAKTKKIVTDFIKNE